MSALISPRTDTCGTHLASCPDQSTDGYQGLGIIGFTGCTAVSLALRIPQSSILSAYCQILTVMRALGVGRRAPDRAVIGGRVWVSAAAALILVLFTA